MGRDSFFTPDPFGPLPPFDPTIPWREQFPPFEKPVFESVTWGPAKIRILIVSDGSSYSETAGFGLGIVIADAFDPTHPDHPEYARFEITKAHRTTTTGVSDGYDNFRFTPGSLKDFDEVWLFGVMATAPYLSAEEVEVVEDFMDAGGGVLAMGDHQDLGLGLCGGIKRVRSMRKWWFEAPAPPPNMSKAPDNMDLTRNDTVQAPVPGGNVNAGSQGDGVPQPIFPSYRYRWTPWGWRWWPHGYFKLVKYPHPVLCGPRGVIEVLPDHMHEGDCIVPDPAFADEFPGGVTVEIVAHGRNVVGRTFGDYTVTDPRSFGLIGAWDGHDPRANNGRVLVDSTWHHWFNINLIGLRAEDGLEYADILAYFRNCAIWLAPRAKQTRMKWAGLTIALLTPGLVEQVLTWRKPVPERYFWFGVHARDALGRIAPQCQSAAWFWEIVRPFLSEELLPVLDPDRLERARAANGLSTRLAVAAVDHTATTIFGGAVSALAIRVNELGLDGLDRLEKEVEKVVERGAKDAAARAATELSEACEQLKKLY